MASMEDMIKYQLKARKIRDPKVLRAMEEVDRMLFVPFDLQDKAYEDRPLPIGENQTISQPYIVAYMAEKLQLDKSQKVLEIGTGCGYNAAILSRLAKQVFSIEINDWLAKTAKENIAETGFENIITKQGDGYAGWPAEAPFDAIILTAAPPSIPDPLKEQLKVGGKILAPVGRLNQKLVLIHKTGENTFKEKTLLPVRFVPMTGKADKGGTYGK